MLSTIHKMLTNPYYKGSVRFRGASYDGLHEPLVAPEVWYRVQAVLTAHQTSGEKTQSHDHYLKGTLYCGQCGSRLTLTNAKSRRGVVYPYFMCTGRHAKRTNCERKSMFVPDIEAAVEDYYRTCRYPNTSFMRCASWSPASSTGSTKSPDRKPRRTRSNATHSAMNARSSCRPTTPAPCPSTSWGASRTASPDGSLPRRPDQRRRHRV